VEFPVEHVVLVHSVAIKFTNHYKQVGYDVFIQIKTSK
jgi:hypothetical protein